MLKKLLCLALLSLVMLAGEKALPAGPFQASYSHYAEDEELVSLLGDFARKQGYGATFSQGVQGRTGGRFENVAPAEFLQGIRNAFGIEWYLQGGNMHFYHAAEKSNVFFTPVAFSPAAARDLLTGAGLVSGQLPLNVLPGGQMLAVAGPPAYVEQLRSALGAFEAARGSRSVMRVFPLRHAWAEDMRITSMDAVITLPGVASILRAMITGTPPASLHPVRVSASQTGLLGQGLAAETALPLPAAPAANLGAHNIPQANIIADPRVNAVLVTDAEYRMPYYEKVIADLDKAVDLVEIHAAIVDIDSNYQRELGINFQARAGASNNGWAGGGSSGVGPNDFSPLPFPGEGNPLGGGLSISTLYTRGVDFFLARVQALEAAGEARVLGRPSVLTMDNVQATLENTSSYYIKVEGRDVVDLFKVEAGTVLRVTPHIIEPGGGIKLAVSVQDDQSEGGTLPTVSVGVLPPIRQTKINTQAVVAEGQSLLIGGYSYERAGKSETGVPLLSSIPLLGNLFKTSTRSSKRMERLILITPRIVRPGQAPPVPEQANFADFRQSPGQNHYELRPAPPATGGCARKALAPQGKAP